MKCMTCKTGELTESTTTYFAEVNGYYIIIENVPCLECDTCGEIFFSVDVAEKLDEIVKHIEKMKDRVTIVDYNAA